jgi:hypothetical protein
MIDINGEQLTGKQAADILKSLYDDAKQLAGEFHNMERSEKFRINWPSETLFAESEWKNFVAATRLMYVQRLADPKTSPADGRKMHLALVLEAMIGQGAEKDNRLQLAPNTQQFIGDRSENRKILEKFGRRPNLRAAFRNSVASIVRGH